MNKAEEKRQIAAEQRAATQVQAASEQPPPPPAICDQERIALSSRLAKAVLYTGGETDVPLWIDTSGHLINGQGNAISM